VYVGLVGFNVGLIVGLVGFNEGLLVGLAEGCIDGLEDTGAFVGDLLGEGEFDGCGDGTLDGPVGAIVGIQKWST